MKKSFLTVIAIIALSIISFIVNAQLPHNGITDLAKLNLKGPVSQVIEYDCSFHTAFGEVSKDDMKPIRYSIFNNLGYFLLDTDFDDLGRENHSPQNYCVVVFNYVNNSTLSSYNRWKLEEVSTIDDYLSPLCSRKH